MINRITKEDALLVLIDFQERIMPAMDDRQALEDASVRLVKGCRILGVPILVTQQYTKGLGATIPSIDQALTEDLGSVPKCVYTPVEKTTFSAMGTPEFVEAVKNSGRKTIIVAGIEAHVCVQQTVIDLLDNGYQVFIAADCVSSRKPGDRRMAKSRMRAAGAVYTTMESVLFELLKGARETGFKEISSLVK